MGIDSMRVGGGRCPPLLVGGLLVACLMLICNWWTLSSENIELVRQIDELNEQLKMSAEERDQCVTLRGNLEKSFKSAEKEMGSLRVRLELQTELKKKNDQLEESLHLCQTDLDTLRKADDTKSDTIDSLKLEKDNFITQLDDKRDENKKLREEVEQLKEDLDRIKLTCNKFEKSPELTQQSKANPIQAKKDTMDQKIPDTAEVDYQDNSKQGILGSTDGNIVESERDAQMKAPASSINK